MGVGFNRESLVAGSLFSSPAQNAFLNIKHHGRIGFITQGYILAQSAPNITLGLTRKNTQRFWSNSIALEPSPTLKGEWNFMPGSFSFPELGSEQFQGSLLLDVGIDEMFLNGVDSTSIPAGAVQSGTPYVPQGVKMTVTAGAPGQPPALDYTFTMPNTGPPATDSTVRPTYAQWILPPTTQSVFVNTGIAPLTLSDYMYNAQCGEAGFAEQQQ